MLKKDGMILELLIIRTKVKTKTMNIIKTEIEGVLIIEPRLFRDSRGYFFESFSEREFEEKVAPIL
jgi:dTDP-4-dehydrorhamnose 3,5-epimerase-like enzyme